MQLDFERIFARFAWLLYLFAALLLYALGVGIAKYLGARLEGGVYWLGQTWVLSLVLFTYFLYLYFDDRTAAQNLGRLIFNFIPWKSAMMLGAIVSATIAASATLMLIQLDRLSQGLWILMLAGTAGVCLYALPPARFIHSGYGELVLSVLIGAGIPAIGFMLQFGGYHRYLAMIAFPITALHLAMWIGLSLPKFAHQQKYEIKSLLNQMGWENGLTLHNLLLLSAFLLFTVAWIFNFPTFAVVPLLVIFPLAVLEIYYLTRIAAGIKPNWNALSISAAALFILPVYVLALAFWTN